MDKIIIIICIAAVLYMIWKMRCLKRDIYEYSSQLEQSLDAMLSGKDMDEFGGVQDILWDKTYERLRRLWHIWQKQNQSNLEEKKQIKELISDISHQTKTPIANLKLYQEILEDDELSPEKRREFLNKMREQTDKLDFLIQSMVKMSRLETGTIEIHQKVSPIYDTLRGL